MTQSKQKLINIIIFSVIGALLIGVICFYVINRENFLYRNATSSDIKEIEFNHDSLPESDTLSFTCATALKDFEICVEYRDKNDVTIISFVRSFSQLAENEKVSVTFTFEGYSQEVINKFDTPVVKIVKGKARR